VKTTLLIKGLVASATLIGCLSACQSQEELKAEQYFAEGFQLYTTYCSNCHQVDGNGMANLYPPINKAEYLPKDRQWLACVIKNGFSGEISVAGKSYNRPMPGNPNLTAIEIAEIITYVYGNWAGDKGYMKIDSVNKALESCSTLSR
jgi:mono/diheme cytochrome c family protein